MRWTTVLGVCLMGFGCGSGGDDRESPQPIQDEDRLAVLEQAAAQYEALASLGPIEQNQKMGAWLAAHPAFEAAGADEMAAWGSFHDGRLAIFDNVDSGSTTPAQLPLRNGAERAPTVPGAHGVASGTTGNRVMSHNGIPASKTVCLYSSAGDAGWHDELETLFALNNENGPRFNYTIWKVADAGVEDYKGLPATCGVFALDSHGTVVKDQLDNEIYGVYTKTVPDRELEAKYRTMLDSRQLAYYTRLDIPRTTYAITSRFVDQYWRFPSNSLVWANICRGASDVAGPFQAAVLNKGASVYASWTLRSFDDIGQQTAVYFFDRMLGANHYGGKLEESPDQRPFPWNTFAADMKRKGLGEYPDDKYAPFVSKLLIDGSGGGFFGLLAPSIAYVAVDDAKDELIIVGTFDPTNTIEVTLAGKTRTVTRKGTTEIRASIPKFGPDSAGEVVVRANGNESNHAWLTAWKGKVTYGITGPSGVLQQTWTIQLNLRGDLRNYRTEPGLPPPDRAKIFSPMQDSSAVAAVKGQHDDTKYRVTWSGGKSVSLLGTGNASLLDGLVGGGEVGDGNVFYLSLSASATNCYNEVIEERVNNTWKEIANGSRNCVAPTGHDLVSTTAGFPPLSRLLATTTITEGGVIAPLAMAPVPLKSSDFGNADTANGWAYMQRLSWQFDLVQGTAPDQADAR